MNKLLSLDKIIKSGVTLLPNQRLVEAGRGFTNLYIVQKGILKDHALAANGNEYVASFYWPGDIIGLDAIYTGKYNFTSVALENSVVGLMCLNDLLVIAHHDSVLQDYLLHSFSRELLKRTIIKSKPRAQQRLALFLLELSERFKEIGYSALDYHLSMSRYDIGSYLGLTTETVSRLLTKFQREKIIQVNKKSIKINDFTKLAERAQPTF